jgi:hypothetical protein
VLSSAGEKESTMSRNGNLSNVTTNDQDFLISENTPENSLIERVVTVKSMGLPGTNIAEVEMIQISEKAIPLPTAHKKPWQHKN